MDPVVGAAGAGPARGFLAPATAIFALLGLCAWASEARAGFDSTPITQAQVGVEYVYDVEASGRGKVEISAPYGLPSWLTLEKTGNGKARLSGTPREGDSGLGIVLLAEDNACRFFLLYCYEYQRFDIAIVANAAPVVVEPGIPDQSAAEDEPFSLDVANAFDDPDGDPLSFTATGLPRSFTIDAAGTIAGTPGRRDVDGSPYRVTVTADDGRGGRTSDAFELEVSALDRADVVLEAVSAEPAPAIASQPVDWRFTVSNGGPQPTGSVELTVEFSGHPFQFDDSVCTVAVEGGRQRAVCTLDPIASGESATVTLHGTAAEAGDVYANASVAPLGDAPVDPDPENNAGAYSLNVGAVAAGEPAQAFRGTAAAAAAGGDLDADGFDDAAIVTGPDSPTEVRLNVENPGDLNPALDDSGGARRGLSAVPLSLEAASNGAGAAMADLDGDGDLDLMIAGGAGAANAVLMNSGSGALIAADPIGSAGDDARAVAAADLDGDGFTDAVFANRGPNAVYLNLGGSGFGAAPPLDGPALDSRDVEAVDVDGDGLPDLVFANADGPVMLYTSAGGGIFARGVTADPGPATSVASGDFNGDGFPDLVLGRAAAAAGEAPANPVYLNDGRGGFVAVAPLGASPTLDVLTADVDGDGLLDVVAINATGAHQVFIGDGSGGFSLQPELFVSRDAARAALAHVGRAGSMDIVVAGKQGTEVFFNDGRGRFGLGDTSPPVIELLGDGEMTVVIDSAYEDPGAVANDDVDGELSPEVQNPVDTKVIGTYTITYTAVDSAGNAAAPVTRTVHVEAKPATGGGGGGGVGLVFLASLLAAALRPARARRAQALPAFTSGAERTKLAPRSRCSGADKPQKN